MAPESIGDGADRLISHEQELSKLGEERIQSLENQATAVLSLVVALGAFGASAINKTVLKQHVWSLGVVVALMLLAACFAVAARGPRALSVQFWTRQRTYGSLEAKLAVAEERLRNEPPESSRPDAIIESWRARRAVASYLAERKALWLTCSLASLLVAFIAAAIAAFAIVN